MSRKGLWIGAAVVAVLIGGAAVFVYGGFYNVAASVPHNPVVETFLRIGMERSVAFHAPDGPPPPLDDPAMIERGLRHFEGNCAPCHGAPGVDREPMFDAMLPQPPDLAGKIGLFTDNEVFWIIRHGLKYTGMPGWPVAGREDEVWDVVAFARLLPDLSVDAYEAMVQAGPAGTIADPSAAELVQQGPTSAAIAACGRCHGLDGTGHPSGAYPRLDGLGEAYILEQLEAFTSRMRRSGFMASAAATLTAAERAEVAADYGAIPVLAAEGRTPSPPDLVAHGAALAGTGIPDRAVPPCASCHQAPEVDAPPLAGQVEDYLATQLRLFRSGTREHSVMNAVAAGLDDDAIAALAAYYTSLPRQ